VQANPDPRELDVIASTGEQVTIGLMAMALKGTRAGSQELHRPQVHVLTDSGSPRRASWKPHARTT